MKTIVQYSVMLLMMLCAITASASSSSSKIDAALIEAVLAEPAAGSRVHDRLKIINIRPATQPEPLGPFGFSGVASSTASVTGSSKALKSASSNGSSVNFSSEPQVPEGHAARFVLFLGVLLGAVGVVRTLKRSSGAR